jgi:ribosomal protein RSM22 (predicted rRNA methylase)
MAAYVLGELPVQTHEGFVQQLWQHTLDTCVIVEPGTPRGFDLVRQAGACLVGAEALILAPFPWDWECLESAHDWCHFSERVPRTRLHRAAKNAELSYEDEKYCYIAASRWEGVPIAARVIRQPQVRSGHIRLVLCTPEGVKHLVVARSQGEAYRRAKHLAWGSAIPVEEASLFGLPV